MSTKLLRIIACKPGNYVIEKIENISDQNFLQQLQNIGFIQNQLVKVLGYTTKKVLYIEINGSKYMLRKKNLIDVYAKKI